MFTMRPVENGAFGKKLNGYTDGLLDSKRCLQQMRHSYESILNDASGKADSPIHFDLRSLKERGIERQPQPKIRPKVTALEKRGYQTEWGKEVRQVTHQNNAQAAYAGHSRTHQISYHRVRLKEGTKTVTTRKFGSQTNAYLA